MAACTFCVSKPTIKPWISCRAVGLPLVGGADPGHPTGISNALLANRRLAAARCDPHRHRATWNGSRAPVSL
jgi:hypothetical protein